MGRHSAPDDDADVVTAATAVDTAPPRGRHARPDEDDDGAASVDLQADAHVGKGNQSTAADLALLREHSDVRARVIAAAVAPLVLYTVALYLAAGFGVYFIWIWVPLVTSGILAGRILDAAHRRHGTG
jgi:hypothetical protein